MALTQQILVLLCKTKANRFCGGCHLSEVLDINLSDWCDSYQLLFSKHEISKAHLISSLYPLQKIKYKNYSSNTAIHAEDFALHF